jgi:N-acetylglutamate synthase-like GNAT family acetyltransferase
MFTLEDIRLRLATEKELASIIDFLSTPEIDQSFVRPLSKRSLSIPERVHSKFSQGFWLIALYQGKIVACRACSGIVDRKTKRVELSTMAIAQPFRRQGLGSMLLHEGVMIARERYNPRIISIDSWSTNKAMEKTALGCGFVKRRTFDDPSKRPPGIQSVEYILDLP